MARIVYMDCTFGASGDMFLGALAGLGFSRDMLAQALSGLGLDGEFTLRQENVSRGGVQATRMVVDVAPDARERSWKQIRELLENSALEQNIKEVSLKAFARLAACEALIHGVDVDHVHFHELSGVDALVDIVGAVSGMQWLAADRVCASTVNVGSGTVQCEHGLLPVPAPATAELLRGVPIASTLEGERTTPTGALLVTEFAQEFGPLPDMRIDAVGSGAGGRDYEQPGAMRIFTGHAEQGMRTAHVVMEAATNIDDMNPQAYPYVINRLLKCGAMDAFAEPVVMKKGRPGCVLRALCAPERLDAVLEIFFQETTTLGVRITRHERVCLDRIMKKVNTDFGPVNVKIGVFRDKIVNVMPEYDDCAAAAAKHGVALLRVMHAAQRAAETNWLPGEPFHE